jgi:hypothetical protein
MADKASNPASSASIPAVAGVHGAAVAKATAMQAAAAVAGPLGGISPGEAATGALPAALAVAQTGRDALLQAIRGGAKLQHVHRASLVAAQQAGLL